jgi:hypothetical protein
MAMPRTVIISSIGAALVAGMVTASSVAGATSAVTNHTVKFVSIQIASHQFSPSTAARADVDRQRGKVVGYDVLSAKFTSKGGVIRGSYAPPGGGNLYFEVPSDPFYPTGGGFSAGKITGGSGRFAGASGSIAATALNKAGTRTAVKIVWHH